MRILVVEDNAKLSGFVATALRRDGFTADCCPTGAEADAALRVATYEAVILDLGLPDEDGMVLLGRWRAAGHHMPVMILTARDGVSDRVSGLDRGADDYLLKPFAMVELLARLRALLRRPAAFAETILTLGNLSLNTTTREVSAGTESILLARRELGALELLMRRAGRVVPKSALEEALYGFGEEIGSNAVEVLVHRLRKRLTAEGSSAQIHTLRGLGYMLADAP